MSRRDPVEGALAASSRRDLRAALGSPRPDLGQAALTRLLARLRELDEPTRRLSISILRSYSTELLQPWLELEARLGGFEPSFSVAPYGQLRLGAADSERLREEAPDLILLFARPQDLSPALAGPHSLLPPDEVRQRAADAVRGLAGILAGVRAGSDAPVIVTLLPRLAPPELGAHESMAEEPAAVLEYELAQAIAAHLRAEQAGVAFVDLRQWLEEVGRRHAIDLRLWHTSQVPFSPEGSHHLARHLFAAAAPLLAPPAKCIVVDADDTLWGGIVGEEGIDGIALGPEYPGSCHVDFQRRLLDFRRRGILLAVASRNEPADVLEVLREHPHQVLREDAFAAIEITWDSKVEALRRIAEALSIGLDSFIFVDDSAHECHAVRSELPEVEVVQTPGDPLRIPGCLDEVTRLEVARLTEEDRMRPEMYRQEAQRRSIVAKAESHDEYLRSLGMVMTVRENDAGSVGRLAQLCGKTNQFNLTVRRHGEAELRRFMEADDSFVLSFSLADVLGDSGIVGVAIVSDAEVDTFLMSCRVIGREAETAFLQALLGTCEKRGVTRLRASYQPTERNGLVADFWQRHGFADLGGGRFERDLTNGPKIESPPIAIEHESGAAV